MRSAGFVLTGGKSSRMGQDKGLLPYRGHTLVEHVAAEVSPGVTLIGPPDRYGHLGLPVCADLRPGHGPLSGIETALSLDLAEWNVVAACDLPRITADVFEELLKVASSSEADCVIPLSADGREQPLAAVWNCRALPKIRWALDHGVRKVADAMKEANVLHWLAPNQSSFENMNTAEQWSAFLES